MVKTFELDTLKIKFNDPEFLKLDLHQRIRRALRELILAGDLDTGLKLPATRALSKSLGIARDTVESAYVQLQRDGFIERRHGSGTYVCESIGNALRGGRRRPSNLNVTEKDSSALDGLSERGRLIFSGGGGDDQKSITAFATGLPETRSFPIDIWQKLQRQVTKEFRSSLLMHGDPQGAESLRKTIATYLNLERGARCSADQVLILSSTRQALFLCAQLLVDAGKPILMEDPGYSGAHKAFRAAETQLVPIDVDDDGIQIRELNKDRSGANCVYVTPSHQYPTGATLSLERRLELINWAASKSKWIIEDDYDSEFHYDGRPTACVQGLDSHNRTIYNGTFSKTLYPGLRIGYMVLPPQLVKPFTYARSVMDGHTPQVLQLTLARFMENGHYNSHIRSMRSLYSERRSFMIDAISTHLSDIVTPLLPQGGLQIPCLLNDGWREEETLRMAAGAGMQLTGLSKLCMGEKKIHGWLLGYSSSTTRETEQAILRLAKVLRR